MATRMQQRRGLAAQWTAANPVLAAGEIGFETDTNKFKMGNGTSTWSQLIYFANAAELVAAIDAVVGLAPETLNTLSEIADSLGDNPNFLAALATNERVDGVILAGTASVQQAATNAATALSNHSANTLDVHGIVNTALLATTANVATAKTEAISAAATDATTKANAAKSAADAAADGKIATVLAALTKNSVGLTNVDNTADIDKPVSTAQATAIGTAKTEAIDDAADAADTKIAAHNLLTANVHGISDTTVLVTQTELSNAITGVTVDQSELAGVGIDWNTGTEAFDIDSTVATKTYADGAVTTHNSVTTNVHGIANTADLATKTYVDTAATAAVQAVVAAAPAAFDTLKEIADYIATDQTASSAVTTSLSTKAPLASPTFTGTVTLPAEGIVFSDGTQTKAGVPSITTFATEITSNATLAAGQVDRFVPLNGAVTITLPSTGYSTGQSIDFWQSTGTGAQFSDANGVVGTPGRKFRTTNSVVTAMKTSSGWLIFGDLAV